MRLNERFVRVCNYLRLMKNPAIILAIAWFLIRMALARFDLFDNVFTPSLMVNLLFMVMVIYAAIGKLRNTELSFLDIAKAGMRNASTYAFMVAVLMFCYYQFIDDQFIPGQIAEVNQAMELQIEEKGGWEQVRGEFTQENLTQEEYFESQKEQVASLFSPWFLSSSALFAMVLGGVIYSLLATYFQQRLMRKLS